MVFTHGGRTVELEYSRVADPASIAAAFTDLVTFNIDSQTDVKTIEAWATHAAHYGRLALAEQLKLEQYAAFYADELMPWTRR